ncbi:conserved protein, unknown function [Plasmodium malariae]|uniref:Protein FRA10AC1 n=1 Tax=Plasmodium malariae TaxID=5858 RepID=A0A1C3KLI0_PLAMA|nr:conserved protein, unknown function [Plasmodium malariae]
MSYVDLSGYKIPKNVFDALCPFERHKLMMSLRLLEKEKKENKNEQYLNDYDILKKKYNFIHDVSNEKNSLLQRYYNSICNKYVICDLTKYKETKIGLRWRTEEEIINGKGHIICSSKKCNNTDLKTYEFLFQYVEGEITKEVIKTDILPYMCVNFQVFVHLYVFTNVKVRACMDCAYKLHYKKIKKYLKKKEKKKLSREHRKKEKDRERNKEVQKEKDKEKENRKKRNKNEDRSSESNHSLSMPPENRSILKEKKIYYVKKKLEKISLKNKEDKNEENIHFHDLLF